MMISCKYLTVLVGTLVLSSMAIDNPLLAQRRGYGRSGTRVRSSTNRNTRSNATESTSTSTATPSRRGYGSQSNTTADNGSGVVVDPNSSTIPVDTIKTAGTGGLLHSNVVSLRNDAVYERSFLSGATPLPYQSVREEDVPFKARVWREIDTREKINKRFGFGGKNSLTSNNQFINILLKSVRDDSVMAFADESFSQPMTYSEVLGSFTAGDGYDKSAVYDDNGEIVSYEVRPKTVNVDSIYRFRIKEDWFFDRNTSRLFVRIIGIAPVIGMYKNIGMGPNRKMTYLGDKELFWIYYPDLRPTLVREIAYNPYNPGDKTTWEAVFEGRQFSSFVYKSEMNNSANVQFKDYIKDPMFRLYEGEKVKEKIFDYEQSLWSY